jgi:hypothetical protein
MQKYLSNLAASDLLHRSVRESAPASEEDDGHARAINQLRQDLRDAWGSESVVSTLYSQVFGRDEQAGSERVIQFIAPEEFNLLDTRETEPPIIRFAPHGAAEELRIDGLVATESFNAAGSIRIIPMIESSWSYVDPTEAAQAKSDATSRELRRFVPRAGVVAEVLNSFGSIEAIERSAYPIPENDDDLIGGPAVKPEPEPEPKPEAVPDVVAALEGQPEGEASADVTEAEGTEEVVDVAVAEGEPEVPREIKAEPDTELEERPGLLRRFINRFLGRVPAAAPEPALDEEPNEKPKRRSRRKAKADDVAADGDEAVEESSKRRNTKRGSLATEPKKRSRKKKSAEE